MKTFTKHMLAGLTLGCLGLVGAVTADENNTDVRHKVIEIKAHSDQDVKVRVDGEFASETVVFDIEDLQDDTLIEQKLAHLDGQTRDTVLQALKGIKHMGDADAEHSVVTGDFQKKVMVMHKGDGKLAFAHGDGDVDFEFSSKEGEHMVRKHIIIGEEQHVLTGHTSAIVRLIEKGQFSQDELDQIQAAIDAKR